MNTEQPSPKTEETFSEKVDRVLPKGRVENPAEAEDEARMVEEAKKQIEKDGPVEKDLFFDKERDIVEEILPGKVLSIETSYELLDNQISDKEAQIEKLKGEIAELNAVKEGKSEMGSAIKDSLRAPGNLSTEEAQQKRKEIIENEKLQEKNMADDRKDLKEGV